MKHWERRLASGANAVLMAVLVVLAIQLLTDTAGRVAPRWDLSADGTATLLPETLVALERLDERGVDVRITAFSTQQRDALAVTRDRLVRDFLRELEERSPRIRARFVDFDRDRLTAERLGVDRYGTMVLEVRGDRVDIEDRRLFRRRGGGEGRTVGFIGERAVVSGIEQLLAAETRRAYALAGHGELQPYDRGMGDLHGIAEVLSTLGLRTRRLDLLGDDGPPSVPEDAAMVLIIRPTAPVTPAEQDALRDYLDRGGSVGVWLEGDGVTPRFVEELGVLVGNGVVMDRRSMYPWEDRPLLVGRRHPVGEEVASGDLTVVVGHAAPLDLVAVDGVAAAPVLGTGRSGWVERGTERPAVFDPAVDGEGPVEVGVAAEVGGGRVVVYGDSDWVADPLIDEGPGNRSLAAATLRWLLHDQVSGTRAGAPREVRRLTLTAGQLVRVRLGLLVWPLLVLSLGAFLGWLRGRA